MNFYYMCLDQSVSGGIAVSTKESSKFQGWCVTAGLALHLAISSDFCSTFMTRTF